MTVSEFYEQISGDYLGVKQRLKDDKRIIRMLSLLTQDDNFRILTEAILQKDYRTAFNSVHTIKGICLNLGIGTLLVPVNELTEELRSGNPAKDVFALYEGVKKEYERCITLISELLANAAI